ncbi:RNA-directed DNA polymerase from mobile element jockey-like protein [Willisornis vidua]|uniref:RNA-directed DNA polymerase from mobile element jockey-like protein n=1 Tax=Willisornis vidua TaxID=1566151 RepID=A0ABQ9DIM2_9PASS|nr:RNA-directed DNA polymerase from mobile element jockey-like protein [Willisornis vidua]
MGYICLKRKKEVGKCDTHLQEEQKEDPGNYKSVILISVLRKFMEKIMHVQGNQMIRHTWHRFKKGGSCLTNLISFYDQMTFLVDEGKAVHPVCLDFSKAFVAISQSTLLEKLAAYDFDGCTVPWVKSWLDGKAQTVVVNGVTPS